MEREYEDEKGAKNTSLPHYCGREWKIDGGFFFIRNDPSFALTPLNKVQTIALRSHLKSL